MAVIIGCVLAGAGFMFVRAKLADVPVVSVGLSLAPKVSADEPQNLLIIGTDNADRLPSGDAVRSGRQKGERLADVIMVLRVDPRAKTASLLSIPRDSYIPIEPTGRKSKINSATAGPNGALNLIDTIKTNFAIPIQHYVEVDFQGFRDLVDVLQGVPIYLATPVRDPNTGLLLETTGCITLDPNQALAYARSRHFEYKKDGKWVSDPSSDLGRISRQQDFISHAAQRAIDRGIRNPSTALSLINAATRAVTIDNTLSVGDIQQIANQFRSVNVDDLEKFQLPTTIGGDASFSYLNVDTAAAEPILDRFRGVRADGTVSKRDVIIKVTGGASAAVVASALDGAGFDAGTTTGSTNATNGNTNGNTNGPAAISFGPSGGPAAALLGRYFRDTPRFVYDKSLSGQRLAITVPAGTVVLVTPRPASAVTVPVGSSVPTTTAVARASTTTTPGSGTTPGDTGPTPLTTAPVGVIPVDEAAAAACTG